MRRRRGQAAASRSEAIGRPARRRARAAQRSTHSGELLATVDRPDRGPGWLSSAAGCRRRTSPSPARRFSWLSPRSRSIRWGGLLLMWGAACWCRSAWPLAGIGAAAASRRQFDAMAQAAGALPRPHPRHRHHRHAQSRRRRGCPAGRGRANELRAPHDARAARGVPLLDHARPRDRAGGRACWRCGWPQRLHATRCTARPGAALFVLLLVPEFFAPLRAFFRGLPGPHAGQGVPPMRWPCPAASRSPAQARPPRSAPWRRAGSPSSFEDVSFTWGPGARPGAGRRELPRAGRRDAGARGSVGRRQVHRHRDPARLRDGPSAAG